MKESGVGSLSHSAGECMLLLAARAGSQLSRRLYTSHGVGIIVDQQFSTFLTLQSFSTVPHVGVTLNHKVILLPLRNCDFATVVNHKHLMCDHCGGCSSQVRTANLDDRSGCYSLFNKELLI